MTTLTVTMDPELLFAPAPASSLFFPAAWALVLPHMWVGDAQTLASGTAAGFEYLSPTSGPGGITVSVTAVTSTATGVTQWDDTLGQLLAQYSWSVTITVTGPDWLRAPVSAPHGLGGVLFPLRQCGLVAVLDFGPDEVPSHRGLLWTYYRCAVFESQAPPYLAPTLTLTIQRDGYETYWHMDAASNSGGGLDTLGYYDRSDLPHSDLYVSLGADYRFVANPVLHTHTFQGAGAAVIDTNGYAAAVGRGVNGIFTGAAIATPAAMMLLANGPNYYVRSTAGGFLDLVNDRSSATDFPGLMQAPSGRVWRLYRDSGTNIWKCDYSRNLMRTFATPAAEAWNDARILTTDLAGARDGSALSLALMYDPANDTRELWFKRSPDPTTWPSDHVVVATVDKAIPFHIFQRCDGSELIASNGRDLVFRSRDMGSHWTAAPTSIWSDPASWTDVASLQDGGFASIASWIDVYEHSGNFIPTQELRFKRTSDLSVWPDEHTVIMTNPGVLSYWRIIQRENGSLIAATFNAAYVSRDMGATWSLLS